MTWERSTRRDRLPSDWHIIRARILRRAGYKCEARDSRGVRCNAPANQCDHITRGDDHSDSNLQALCAPCHRRKTSTEGVEARLPRRRPPERHPGSLR